MFSETRYALNGDLRVAYRTSREGERDIVFVPNWLTNCEILPELPSLRGLGRGDDIAWSADLLRPAGLGSVRSRRAGRAANLGAMDRQHHRGAGRARQPRCSPTRGQRRHRDSGSVRRDVPVAYHRAGRARGLRGSGDWTHWRVRFRGTPRIPWNEEIRATWARHDRLAASPATYALVLPLVVDRQFGERHYLFLQGSAVFVQDGDRAFESRQSPIAASTALGR